MSSRITHVEGDWKIVDYSQHPGCVHCKIQIKGVGFDPNDFKIDVHVVNDLKCTLKHNPATNLWKTSAFFSTKMRTSPEEAYKEHALKRLICGLKKLKLEDEQRLIIETNDGEQVRLKRLP